MGPQGRSGRVENLVPTGIRSWTFQPVVTCYTDCSGTTCTGIFKFFCKYCPDYGPLRPELVANNSRIIIIIIIIIIINTVVSDGVHIQLFY